MKTFWLGVCVILLTACGGGGGGSSSRPLQQDALQGAPTGGTATQQVIASVPAQQIAVLMPSLERLLQTSSSTSFGSVTQTYSNEVSPVTGVDTTFDGSRFVLNLNRQDGTTTTLDSSSHETLLAVTYDANTNPVTRRPAVDGSLYTLDQDRVTTAGVAIEWSSTDFTDYLAGGYWVHVDLTPPTAPNTFYGAELGAFIDGPDYQDRASMPASGTATYTGIAAGAYVSSYGTDIPITGVGTVPGSVGVGDYRGEVSLVADFGQQSVSGQIDNISIDGVVVTPMGVIHPVDGERTYTIHLGAASIGQNGRVSGLNVSVTHPMLTITGSSGTWASQFSTQDGSQGHPQAIAGTHAGQFETAGGSQSIFAGAHYGASERFD